MRSLDLLPAECLPGPAGNAELPAGLPVTGQPPVGRRFQFLLALFLTCAALLGASGVYLLALFLLEWSTGQTYTNLFTLSLLFGHVALGLLTIPVLLLLGIALLMKAWRTGAPFVVGSGSLFLGAALVSGLTGILLVQFDGLPRLPSGSWARYVVYSLHLLGPVAAAVLYARARCARPALQWRWGKAWVVAVGAFVMVMAMVHARQPQRWHVAGTGEQFFEPAKTRTLDGTLISADVFLRDDYCRKCHEDIYQDWAHSAHRFSSFNNPIYRFSVRETRKVALERDGNTRASRWCAGCHDPVPFLSGAFDDPRYDDVNDVTAHAGLTCTVCHAITHVNSTIGNGDYTIEEPLHYPYAFSANPLLAWLSRQVVKARPDFHRKTFLKPFHRSPEFCSTCHKVSLPMALNHYKEFVRGQNHYDTFLLSGASGHGARGFYYPPEAKTQCADCHMPLRPSADFGSRDFDGSGRPTVHSHLFPGANTGTPWLASCERGGPAEVEGLRQAAQAQADFLRGTDPDGKDSNLRIDLFGLKEGGRIDGKLIAPLRPQLPRLRPGGTYLLEIVLRTLNVGHQFPQGTVDSNEIWVELTARSGERVLGRSGGLHGSMDAGRVDPWAHFVNALLLDRHGNRINRHNPQDIFTTLYDHQIPPGAAQVVHYELQVPAEVPGPIELSARLRYRKIDHEYLSLICVGVLPEFPALLAGLPGGGQPLRSAVAGLLQHQLEAMPVLPIVDLCEDRLTLPVQGVAEHVPPQTSPIQPAWQRWNDYGIGCYLEGGPGSKKGELRQAEQAFQHLLTLGDREAHAHAHLNLARVYYDEGRLAEAVAALNQARSNDPAAPWWTVAWLTGLVNAQNGHLDDAIANFQQVLAPQNQPRDRKFDFTRDYVVRNDLASALFKRAQQETDRGERDQFLRRAVEQYDATLRLDGEDLDAHYGLAQCFALLGEGAALAPVKDSTPVSAGYLQTLMHCFEDERLPRAQRLEAAGRLEAAVTRFAALPVDPSEPRLPVFRALLEQCRQVYASEAPSAEHRAALRPAAARLLGLLHRQAHGIFKPDDNARDRATRLYRQTHPAADHAAQAIVLYPLLRPSGPDPEAP